VRQKRQVALPEAGKQEWLRYARRVSHRDGSEAKTRRGLSAPPVGERWGGWKVFRHGNGAGISGSDKKVAVNNEVGGRECCYARVVGARVCTVRAREAFVALDCGGMESFFRRGIRRTSARAFEQGQIHTRVLGKRKPMGAGKSTVSRDTGGENVLRLWRREERAILILGCGDSRLEDNAGPVDRLLIYGEFRMR